MATPPSATTSILAQPAPRSPLPPPLARAASLPLLRRAPLPGRRRHDEILRDTPCTPPSASRALSRSAFSLGRRCLLRPTAVSGELSSFSLTPRSCILRYNLSVGLRLRNANRRIAIHYDAVAAQALYEGQRFTDAALPDFFQDTGDTTPAFAGRSPLLGGSGGRLLEGSRRRGQVLSCLSRPPAARPATA
ncbi:hypothetical protein ACP70R_013999 [Stipagrostis hirtigluma subsp. patula]